MARTPTARRSSGRRAGSVDRPARQHVSIDLEPAVASGAILAAVGPTLSASPAHPAEEGTIAEVTLAACWDLLPTAERDRLGLRFSRLVLKAIRPLDSKEDRS